LSQVEENKEIEYSVFGVTNTGMVRDHNEDAFLICINKDDHWSFDHSYIGEFSGSEMFLIVADGMGGTNAGEVASSLAIEEVKRNALEFNGKTDRSALDIKTWLNSVILSAHSRVKQGSIDNKETRGMGTTLAIAVVTKDGFYIAWVGDCRFYIYHPIDLQNYNSNNPKHVSQHLRILSDDDAIAWKRVISSNGQYSREQARNAQDSHVITQFIGDLNDDPIPKVIGPFECLENSRLIVCSDGLTGMVPDEQIQRILTENSETDKAAFELVKAANEAGGHDNITVTIFDLLKGKLTPVAPTVDTELDVSLTTKQTRKSRRNLMPLFVAMFLLPTILVIGFYVLDQNKNIIEELRAEKDVDTLKNTTLIPTQDTLLKKPTLIDAKDDGVIKKNKPQPVSKTKPKIQNKDHFDGSSKESGSTYEIKIDAEPNLEHFKKIDTERKHKTNETTNIIIPNLPTSSTGDTLKNSTLKSKQPQEVGTVPCDRNLTIYINETTFAENSTIINVYNLNDTLRLSTDSECENIKWKVGNGPKIFFGSKCEYKMDAIGDLLIELTAGEKSVKTKIKVQYEE